MTLKKMLLLFLCFTTLGRAGCSGERPKTLGVMDGKFAPCPRSPNCVSTQAEDARHRLDPIAFDGPASMAQEEIRQILQAMARTTIVTERPGYLHAEARSRIFGFVDDVEFYFDAAEGLIHFRSAARLGYGDNGVNRRRMEHIREQFAQQPAAQ